MAETRWLIKRRHIFIVLLLTLQNFRECTSNKTTMEKVSSLPKNEIEKKKIDESLNCGPNLTAIYALDSLKAETLVKCGQNKAIHGLYCPEFNEKGIQPKYSAPCTICNSTYMASDSFKFPNCFKMYGGILSEGLRKEKENMQRQIDEKNAEIISLKENMQRQTNEKNAEIIRLKENMQTQIDEKNADILSLRERVLRNNIIITLIPTLIFVFAMYVFCFRFWVRKYHQKEDILFVDFIRTVFNEIWNSCIKMRSTVDKTNSRHRDEASEPMLQTSEDPKEGNKPDSPVAFSEEDSVHIEEISKKATTEMIGHRAINIDEENSAVALSQEDSVGSEETRKKATEEMIGLGAINIEEEISTDSHPGRIQKDGDLKSINCELDVENSDANVLFGKTTL